MMWSQRSSVLLHFSKFYKIIALYKIWWLMQCTENVTHSGHTLRSAHAAALRNYQELYRPIE